MHGIFTGSSRVKCWLLTCSSLQQIVCFLLSLLIQASKTLITFSDKCFALHVVTLMFCSLDWKLFIWFKGFWLYEIRPCISVKFVRNKETHTEWLPQLLQGQTHTRCPKSHGTLQGDGSQQVNSNSFWFNLLGWDYSGPRQNFDPCLPSSFQCQNCNVLHDAVLGTARWVCALDLAFFLLNFLCWADHTAHTHPLCHCLSSSAQILPFPCAPFPQAVVDCSCALLGVFCIQPPKPDVLQSGWNVLFSGMILKKIWWDNANRTSYS